MKVRVAVVYGGRSGEHEISLRSAQSIMDAMDPEKYRVIQYRISKEGKWSPKPISPEPGGNPEIDVVFPVLHGTFGEDGTVQGLLELADLAYVGAGVLASAVAMDKEVMKRLAVERGLPVVEYRVLTWDAIANPEAICGGLPYPVFVKPANLGSSVGISKANNGEELKKAVELAASFDRKIIVERGIQGREFECSVLGNETPEAAIPCEILPSQDFYDYDDKYLHDRAQLRIPAELPDAAADEVRALAVRAFVSLRASGMARVDFFYEADGRGWLLNEINTIPGFTPQSMYPKLWEATGVPYAELIDRLVGLALARHERRSHFSTKR